jgi:hypothetical protein
MTTKTTPVVPPVVDPAVAAVVPPEADDFDAAFAEITQEEDTSKPVAKVEPVAAVVVDPPVATAAVVDPVVEPAVAEPVVVEPPVVDAALTAAQARIAELEAAAKAPAPAAVVEPVKEVAAPAIEWYKPDAAEVAALAEYEKQWPEISAAEAMRTKAAIYNAMQYTFAEIHKAYGPKMDRFAKMSDAIESELSVLEVRDRHSDYSDVRPKVLEWVDKELTGAFKKGAKAVIESGSPDEVAELIAEYKKTHPSAAAPVAAPAAPAAPAKTELSDKAKKAATKLTVVDSQRTAQVTVPDASDYESAWNEATAAGK